MSKQKSLTSSTERESPSINKSEKTQDNHFGTRKNKLDAMQNNQRKLRHETCVDIESSTFESELADFIKIVAAIRSSQLDNQKRKG
jgi:hypothetical protein